MDGPYASELDIKVFFPAPTYLYICYGYVLDTYPYICTMVKIAFHFNSLEFWLKLCSFWVCLSIRVSFVLVGVGRMPCRCAATEITCVVIQFLLHRKGYQWSRVLSGNKDTYCSHFSSLTSWTKYLFNFRLQIIDQCYRWRFNIKNKEKTSNTFSTSTQTI